MISKINKNQFRNAFRDKNRDTNFSYEAKNALFDHLIQIEEECATIIELDVIAICCEYQEMHVYDCFKEFDVGSIDQLREQITVIDVVGKINTVIVQAF